MKRDLYVSNSPFSKRMKLIFYILLNGIYFSYTEGVPSIQIPNAGNCEENTVLTCHVSGNIGSTRWDVSSRNIMSNGGLIRPEDRNKYTENKRTSSFTLTIHNTSLTDEGDYRCGNEHDDSEFERLNIECKASSATHNVTSGKKVQIIVDKLYPASPALNLTFERQNSAINISGSKTCSNSTRYSGYYRCVWTSAYSLDDGLYTYSAVVTTITQASPLTGFFKIASPGSPLFNNTVQLNSSHEVLYGNEEQPLTIQCTSKGGYPVPTVSLYQRNISESKLLATTSSGTLQNDAYTVNIQHTFTPAAIDNRNYFICRSYYPQADSAQNGSISKFVLFYLTVEPSQPNVTQTSVVSAGNVVTVSCSTTGCRPAANISWLYQDVNYTCNATSKFDTTTETFTVISTYDRQVTAADNGQTIKCIVTHPALDNPQGLTESINLNVQYPPIVSVSATKTTVKAFDDVNLTCIAKGLPDSNYKYGKWIQRWPMYNFPVSERPGSETLELTALTYEHSGYYTCTASNGIKVVGTNAYFVEGKATLLLVKFVPIIINLGAKIASRINWNLTFSVDYFSNIPGSEVKLYKIVKGKMKPKVINYVKTDPVDVELPVFLHLIPTNGMKASVTIQIQSEEDFGYYNVDVTNEIGSSNKTFEIVKAESPSAPTAFTIDYIQYNKARFSWKCGYNGGLPQTFVIQIGTDEKTWRDVEVYDRIKQEENRSSTILTDLHDSTTYYVRMFAKNEIGNSKLTETLNFITSQIKVKISVEKNDTSVLIVGVALGVLNVAQIVYAIYVTVLLKRRPVLRTKGVSKHESCQTWENRYGYVQLNTKDPRMINSARDNKRDFGNYYTGLDTDIRGPDPSHYAVTAF